MSKHLIWFTLCLFCLFMACSGTETSPSEDSVTMPPEGAGKAGQILVKNDSTKKLEWIYPVIVDSSGVWDTISNEVIWETTVIDEWDCECNCSCCEVQWDGTETEVIIND